MVIGLPTSEDPRARAEDIYTDTGLFGQICIELSRSTSTAIGRSPNTYMSFGLQDCETTQVIGQKIVQVQVQDQGDQAAIGVDQAIYIERSDIAIVAHTQINVQRFPCVNQTSTPTLDRD